MTKPKTEKKSYDFQDGPLTFLFSCRVRLTEEMRQGLKDAYNKIRFSKQESVAPLSGSSVSSTTFTDTATQLYKELGMSAVVIGDLLGSRESLSLPVLLKLQRGLKVEVFTENDIRQNLERYVDYVWNEMEL